MPKNLWERAKAALKALNGPVDRIASYCEDGDTINFDNDWDEKDAVRYRAAFTEANALLAEMERVECVEGQTVKDRGSTNLYHFRAGDTMGGDWHKGLLLLPEESK